MQRAQVRWIDYSTETRTPLGDYPTKEEAYLVPKLQDCWTDGEQIDYIVYIMEGAQIASPLTTASIQYVINVVLTIPALIYIDKWGRRPSLIIGSFFMMTWLFVSGEFPLSTYRNCSLSAGRADDDSSATRSRYTDSSCF